MQEKNHSNLVQEAKDAYSNRIKMTNNRCDSILMIFESVLRVVTCGMNRWSKVIKGGVDQIKGELDIYNYM